MSEKISARTGFVIGAAAAGGVLVTLLFFLLVSSRQTGAPALADESVAPSEATAPARVPTQVEYHDNLAFFNPVTGESAIWYHKRPDGGYDLFDAPGFHPNYGREAPLQVVTPLIAGDIRLSFDKNVSVPTQARRAAPRPVPQRTVPREQAVSEQAVSPAPVPQAPIVRLVTIPAGTRLEVVLDRQLSTGTNDVGDPFPVSLARAVVVDGQTILAEGTRLTGEITALEKPGRVSGVAKMTLVLQSVNGAAIDTAPLTLEGEASKGRDAATVGIGAGIGAAIGAILGGGSGAAKGTAIGAGGGTGTVLATKGQDLVLEPEKALTFTLSRNVEIER